MSHPLTAISFIIPAYNCQDTIKETVDSIFEGNFTEGDEVIIVEDASTDQTAQVLLSLLQKHPEITILTHRINKGTAAAARNTGIDQARNELIFTLDADNVLLPGSVSKLKKYLLENDAQAAAFGEIHFFKEVAGEKKLVYKTVFKSGVFTLAEALATNYFIGQSGNYLFTKSSWRKAGRYFEPGLINQTLDSWTFTICQLGTGAKLVKLANTWYLHRRTPQSHWEREKKRGSISLAALVGLIPFLDQLLEEDADYIMGKEGRYSWFDDLEKRPIRLKSGEVTSNTTQTLELNEHVKLPPLYKRIVRAVLKEIGR